MKTNQITPAANQSQTNNETVFKTLDNADLENLSGGASDYFLKIDGLKGESAESSSPLNIEIKVTHNI